MTVPIEIDGNDGWARRISTIRPSVRSAAEPLQFGPFGSAWKALQDAADATIGAWRSAFMAATGKLLDGFRPAAVEEAIAAGAEVVSVDTFDTALAAGTRPLLVDAARSAASISASFEQLNPETLPWIDEHGARLVTAISEETRAGIRAAVRAGLEAGQNPKVVARSILPQIGLTEASARSVATLRERLLAGGMDPDKVDAKADRYAQKLLRLRAETIARTEALGAHNGAESALWAQARDRGLLAPTARRRWIVTRDDRTCPRCVRMANQVRAIDEPFVEPGTRSAVAHPPLHPRCRCAQALIFPDQAGYGGPVSAAEPKPKPPEKP